MGSLNQLPPWVEISGDVRLTPFYEMNEMKAKLDGFVADMNANITDLKTFGPASRYEIEDCRGAPRPHLATPPVHCHHPVHRLHPVPCTPPPPPPPPRCTATPRSLAGKLELKWGTGILEGIACSLDSEGHKALCKATEAVLGEAKPYSICGSLPLVRDLQRAGFDVQMTGFGRMDAYHADNEYCLLSDMSNGFDILVQVVSQLEG